MSTATLPCPTCSGVGIDTCEDRHAGTSKDTCQTCDGTGMIEPRTGETPETSFRFPDTNAKPVGDLGREADISADAVAKAMDEDGGWWKSCSGCHETNEGHETGHYPYSELFRCHVGAGCCECGGLGVRWEYFSDSDFAAMAREAALTPPPSADAGAGLRTLRLWLKRRVEEADLDRDKYDPMHPSRSFHNGEATAYDSVLDQMPALTARPAGAGDGWHGLEADEARIVAWIVDRFGADSLSNPMERADRLLEEAIEMHQAVYAEQGLEAEYEGRGKASLMVLHVYDKTPGDPRQEMGGVMTCALALGHHLGVRIDEAAQTELTRIEALDKAHFDRRHQAKVDAGIAAQHDRPAASPAGSDPSDPPRLSYSGKPIPDGVEACEACGEPFKPGEMVLDDHNNGGTMHAACIGPERDNYRDGEGNPLKDSDPIPTGYPWEPADAPASPAGAGSAGSDRERLAAAICDGLTNGNVVYANEPEVRRVPYRMAADAVLALSAPPAQAETAGEDKRKAIARWVAIEAAAETMVLAADNAGGGRARFLKRLCEAADELQAALNQPEPDTAWMRSAAHRHAAQAGAGDGWQPIETAPKDGTRFWGKDGDDAIAMLWHEGFQAFVSSWQRMTMAPGLLIDGLSEKDHSPVEHRPTGWMAMPAHPPAAPIGTGNGEASV